jgi:hypothetical protein
MSSVQLTAASEEHKDERGSLHCECRTSGAYAGGRDGPVKLMTAGLKYHAERRLPQRVFSQPNSRGREDFRSYTRGLSWSSITAGDIAVFEGG